MPLKVETPTSEYTKGVFLIALAAVLWSTGGHLIKATTLDAVQVSFWRSLFSLLTFLAIVKPKTISFSKKDLIASACYGSSLILFPLAVKSTNVSDAIFIQYFYPIYVLGGLWFLFKERPSKLEMQIAFLGLIGMIIFFINEVEVNHPLGILWACFSGLAFAGFILFSRKKQEYELEESMIMAFSFSVILSALLVLIVFWNDPRGSMNKDLYFGFAVGTSDSILVAFLGVFQVGIPCLLFARGFVALSTIEVALITMLEPVLIPFWEYAFGAKIPETMTIIGGGIIVLALFFLFYKKN